MTLTNGTRTILLCILTFTVWSGGALAEDENDRVGFSPKHVFDGAIQGEHVDIMSGNVVLNIPIGSRYQLNDWFGYQLQLYYNSKVWIHDCDPLSSQSCPGELQFDTNSWGGWGQGFLLHLGRVTRDTRDSDGVHRYIGPDGSTRYFCEFTSNVESECWVANGNLNFTPESSPLKVVRIDVGNGDSKWEIHPGDGTVHITAPSENGPWPVTRIETVARNSSGEAQHFVEYDTLNADILLADSLGRQIGVEHSSYTDNSTTPPRQGTAVTLSFPSFAGSTTVDNDTTADYTFVLFDKTFKDPVLLNANSSYHTETRSFLYEIHLPGLIPGINKYSFDYSAVGAGGDFGHLTEWSVPTGATIRYHYRSWWMASNKPLNSDMYLKELIANGQTHRWSYTRFGTDIIRESFDWYPPTLAEPDGLEVNYTNPRFVRVLDPYDNLTVYSFHATAVDENTCSAAGCDRNWTDCAHHEIFDEIGFEIGRVIRLLR